MQRHDEVGDDAIALALHEAVKGQQEAGADDILAWAAHIHL